MIFWLAIIAILSTTFTQLSDGNTLLLDDFSSRAHRWSLQNSAKSEVAYRDNGLAMSITSPGLAVWSVPDFDLKLSHYHLTTQAEWLSGTPDSALGVVFHYQDRGNFYWLEVQPNGKVSVQQMLAGMRLPDPLLVGEIKPTQRAEIDLIVFEGEFLLTINGEDLPPFQDDSLPPGLIGLYTRAGKGTVQTLFDQVRVVDVIAE